MIPRIKNISPLYNYRLSVEFDDGRKVVYNVLEDIETIPAFAALKSTFGLFNQVQLDTSRTCVYWNDEIDLASDTIYEYGVEDEAEQVGIVAEDDGLDYGKEDNELPKNR